MCNSQKRISFSLLLNPQSSTLFELWLVKRLSHRKAYFLGLWKFQAIVSRKEGVEWMQLYWMNCFVLFSKYSQDSLNQEYFTTLNSNSMFDITDFLQMIFQFLPLRIYNLRFRFRDMRHRLNLCVWQITAKSVDLKHRLKIKFLFNDILGTLPHAFLNWCIYSASHCSMVIN